MWKARSLVSELAVLLVRKFALENLESSKLIVRNRANIISVEIPDQGQYSDGSPSKAARVVNFFKGLGVNDDSIKETHPLVPHNTTTCITLTEAQVESAIKGLNFLMDPQKSSSEFKPEINLPASNVMRC